MTSDTNKESDQEDMDIEQITQKLKKVRIPQEICFGRGNTHQRTFERRQHAKDMNKKNSKRSQSKRDRTNSNAPDKMIVE
jgi:hypothetical protein